MPAGMTSKGENINHFNGVRFRILGSGNVLIKLVSLPDNNDNVVERNLIPLDLDALNQNREPLKKANFMQQRSKVVLKTNRINEVMKINRIVVFVRPVFTNYPG